MKKIRKEKQYNGEMLAAILKIPYLRLKYRFMPNKAQKFWAQGLLDAHGIAGKLGQVLSQGKNTELPKSSLTPIEATRLFKKSFARDITVADEVFAASMGQVFFVRLDDKDLAVKILHPGIKEKLKSEIDNILLLGNYFSKVKNFSFDKDTFRRFLTDCFEEETDLKREAHYQTKFRSIFLKDERFHIPEVVTLYSDHSILTQELVKCQLAMNKERPSNFYIFDFFFTSLFHHQLLHSDLNDRNWGMKEDGTVVIYDFGSTQIVSERRISGLQKLFQNTEIVKGFQEIGVRLLATSFNGREQELRDALFGPLVQVNLPWDFKYGEFLKEKLGEEVKQLREFSDPWVLMLMRSFFSLIRMYQERQVSIPMETLIKPYLVREQDSSMASGIKIEVMEGKNQMVFMTMPLSSLENLEQLMPEKVLTKIRDENIDLNSLVDKVIKSRYEPQELFHLKVLDRSYKVWIE